MALGDVPEGLQEPRLRGHQARVPHDGLQDHGGQVVAVAPEELLHRLGIVEREHGGGLGGCPGHPGGVGETQRGHAAPGRHQEGIGVAVVASGELEKPVPLRVRPGQSKGAHGGLGPRVHQPDHLDPGDHADDPLRQLHLGRGGGPVAGAPGELLLQGGVHLGVGVAQDQGTPAQHVVHVAAALGVVEPGSTAPLHEEGLPAHRLEGADGRVDAPGNQLPGSAPEVLGPSGPVVAAHGAPLAGSLKQGWSRSGVGDRRRVTAGSPWPPPGG